MSLAVATDPAAFFAAVRPELEAEEEHNGLLLGFLAPLAADPPASAPPFLARREGGGVAYLTALNLIVSRGMGAEAGALARALRDRGLDPPGVVGPEADARAIADAWAALRGCRAADGHEQMLYRLDAVVPPAGVPGRMRPMAPADVDRVAGWVLGFHRDALPHDPYTAADARANAEARAPRGMTFLWEVDGSPVAMAALARPTRRSVTVNAVYTPPEHRGRGYASALSAAVSAEGLARGHAYCVLFADLANPTTNKIYRAIGYRPLGRHLRLRFDRGRPAEPSPAP